MSLKFPARSGLAVALAGGLAVSLTGLIVPTSLAAQSSAAAAPDPDTAREAEGEGAPVMPRADAMVAPDAATAVGRAAEAAADTDAARTEIATEAEVVVSELAPGSGVPLLDAADVEIDDFLWVNRLVLVFSDTPADPRYTRQIEMLTARPADLATRDVVVIVDTDRNSGSPVRARLRPRGFSMVLIGKDGEVDLRKPFPWDVRELSRSIDKTPLRQQEIRDGSR
ncbi:MAG: DUF4174 domain-containing protein [Celeribacter sp.]